MNSGCVIGLLQKMNKLVFKPCYFIAFVRTHPNLGVHVSYSQGFFKLLCATAG